MQINEILDAARSHYQNLQTDITNAKDRIEHIRLTALAEEAFNLFKNIEILAAAAPAASATPTYGAPETFNETQEVLDLPDFKSPYNPDA